MEELVHELCRLTAGTYNGDIPGHAGEDDGCNKHDDEDNPGIWLALAYLSCGSCSNAVGALDASGSI